MTETTILDEGAVSEIEARLPVSSYTTGVHKPQLRVLLTTAERDALCATVKHLRERVQLLDSRWCECGHTKDKHGFFSDHDECYECDQASPDLCCVWRPVARPDTQLEHLQSQLEQLRATLAEETKRADGNFASYERVKASYSETVNQLAQVEQELATTKQHRNDLIEELDRERKVINKAPERTLGIR